MRKKLIIGNWKMYNNTHKSSLLLYELSQKIETRRDVEIVLCPNMLALQTLSLQVNRRQFKLGAQNCYWRDEGAFTGEVSAPMLRGIADYAIIGHSERRHIFGEVERDIRQKVQACLRNGIRPILCIGETAMEHADGETVAVICDQLTSGLANVTSEEIADIVITYEPIWAIGTGSFPTDKDLSVVEKAIRKHILSLYGRKPSKEVRVLYGGSVNETNAHNFLNIHGIDGLLVGGASLRSESFAKIAEQAYEVSKAKKAKKEGQK